MSQTTFRHYESPADGERQYALWLEATAGLPRAWRSSLRNVRHQLQTVERFPTTRIYAERDGELVGYIGTHPPFDWPPIGRTVPFGFPWTFPVDCGLERDLYDRMMTQLATTFSGDRWDVLIQRFRGSWERHVSFIRDRGWRECSRSPILECSTATLAEAEAAAVGIGTDTDLEAFAAMGREDTAAVDQPDVVRLRTMLDEGWLSWPDFWFAADCGGVVLDVRPPWAEAKLIQAPPGSDGVRRLLAGVASALRPQGVTELYFAVDEGATARHAQLVDLEFAEVDASVYWVRDES